MMRSNQLMESGGGGGNRSGSNPVKRRATPIPVNPPRIPTPMPSVNNNNPHSRVVVGGCNKDQQKNMHYESQNAPNSTKNPKKYLDNDVKTSWINPRLISKIDIEAVISSDYIPPSQRTTINRNNIPIQYIQQQIIKEKREKTPDQHQVLQVQVHRTSSSSHHSEHHRSDKDGQQPLQQPHAQYTAAREWDARASGAAAAAASKNSRGPPVSIQQYDAPVPLCKRAERTAKHVAAAGAMNKHASVMNKHETKTRHHLKSSGSTSASKPLKHNLNVTDKIAAKHGLSSMVVDKILNGGVERNYEKFSVKTTAEKVHKVCEKVPSSEFKVKSDKQSKHVNANANGNFIAPVHCKQSFLTPVTFPDSVSVSSSNYSANGGVVGVNGVSGAGGVFGLYSETKYAFSVNGLPGNPAQTSAAAAFFARAAQKLNLSSSPHRRKRHSSGDEECSASGFSGAIQKTPPPVPPALLRRIGVKEITGVGKVKVMLRVSAPTTTEQTNSGPSTSSTPTTNTSQSNSFFSLDKRKKQVTLFDPAVCGGATAPEDRRVGVAAPKMFAFDAIFSQDDSQTEVCSSALTDVIHAVINGSDGCLFCFGHAGLGKSYTMLGTAENAHTLGVIPCAISWLFRGINEQKQKTGARFSVRVSAVEVCGPSNQLKDLLAGHANDSEQSPGVYLRDDPVFGTQLQNHAELRVPSAEKAAWYLDAALDSRIGPKSDSRDSHLLFTLHVYQYSVAGKGGVAGGRSRLHLIDLGNSERRKSSGGIPLSGLGNILLAIFNGQKHLPYREHKLTHLLKECLGSLTCHAAMIAHVSPFAQNYTDTLTTVQLASRIHRMRRRKIKFVSAGTGNGSGGSSGEEATRTTGTSSEPDPSSSDLSADTVIYVGPADEGTDGEHPPVYIPSLNSGDNRCVMSKALRGSSAEQRTPTKVPILQKSPSIKKTSPAHSASAPKPSPIRSPSVKTTKPQSEASPSKVAQPTPPVNTSDEQWIDGPRISKSRVAEARHFMKEVCHVKKRETWIDGPMQSTNAPASALVQNQNAGYGYMDSHKKSMIRKWVENQTSQIQRTQHTSPHKTTTSSNKEPFKELTQFKTYDETSCEGLVNSKEVLRPLVEDNWKLDKVEESVIRTGLKLSNGKTSDIPECVSPEEKGSTEDETEKVNKDEDDYDDDEDGIEIPPALPLIQPLSSREVSMESLNDRLLKERLRSSSVVDYEPQDDDYDQMSGDEDDDEILEIIEVEEPLEPVPTQDCCLQVTEEDIAYCMGLIENPLPEVDQDEHPLRILSQENLTVVSTFTDSMSVYTDLERMLPKHRYGPNYNIHPEIPFHTYSDYEDPPDCSPSIRNGNLHDPTTRRKFDQLARLHELYTNRLAKANVTNSPTYKENRQQQQQQQHHRSLTRCESLSLSDMLYGGAQHHETSSIYSEPAYIPDQEKFCENCKVNMSRPATAQNWYADPTISASTTQLCTNTSSSPVPAIGGRFQRYCHRIPRGDNYSLVVASLRHPDGASNPNLKEEETERIPGNGASLSDHDEETDEESKLLPGGGGRPTVISKDFRVGEMPPPLPPPPLLLEAPTNRRMLSIESGLASMKLQQKQQQAEGGYDSGHDSTPRTSKHSPAAISRRAESGYDSVVRDSESSSIDSDTSRLSHTIHSSSSGRRGKCRHKHDRSFCSWLLNPFTCKYIDEPPETHF